MEGGTLPRPISLSSHTGPRSLSRWLPHARYLGLSRQIPTSFQHQLLAHIDQQELELTATTGRSEQVIPPASNVLVGWHASHGCRDADPSTFRNRPELVAQYLRLLSHASRLVSWYRLCSSDLLHRRRDRQPAIKECFQAQLCSSGYSDEVPMLSPNCLASRCRWSEVELALSLFAVATLSRVGWAVRAGHTQHVRLDKSWPSPPGNPHWHTRLVLAFEALQR